MIAREKKFNNLDVFYYLTHRTNLFEKKMTKNY